MHNPDSDWEKKLTDGPYRHRRFTAAMMTNVEKKLLRLESSSNRKKRPVWLAISTACGCLLLALLLTARLSPEQDVTNDAPPALPHATGEAPAATQPPEAGEEEPLKLHAGNGGELTAWEHMNIEAFRESDRTIIRFTTALLQKQLGAMSGLASPSDALWEDPARKETLAAYELSSPWVSKVLITKVEEQTELIHYFLDLTLGDSTGAELKETLRVDIAAATGLIREAVTVQTSDEIESDERSNATPPDSGESE